MARPIKKGLDYFPNDTVYENNLELVIAEFGMVGLGIVNRLWQAIYLHEGYYCVWNDDVALLFGRNNNVSCNVVSEVIKACFRRGIFDEEIFNKHGILTSKGIQKRYIEACKKRSSIKIAPEYLLIPIPSTEVFSAETEVFGEKTSVISPKMPQRKVKESKVNKSKLKESKERISSAAADTTSQTDSQEVISLFNDICKSLSRVTKLTDSRSKMIEQADRELDGDFKSLFEKVEKSDFLSGRNGKWTGCGFDWILKPQNLLKIIEGTYDNKEEVNNSFGRSSSISDEYLEYIQKIGTNL